MVYQCTKNLFWSFLNTKIRLFFMVFGIPCKDMCCLLYNVNIVKDISDIQQKYVKVKSLRRSSWISNILLYKTLEWNLSFFFRTLVKSMKFLTKCDLLAWLYYLHCLHEKEFQLLLNYSSLHFGSNHFYLMTDLRLVKY